MGKVMNSLSKMFCVWVTKQVSHFNGTSCQLAWMNRTTKIENICQDCECRDESPSHITRCQDPGWLSVFKEFMDSIMAWMSNQQTGPGLVGVIIIPYCQGDQTSSLPSPPELSSLDDSTLPRLLGMG